MSNTKNRKNKPSQEENNHSAIISSLDTVSVNNKNDIRYDVDLDNECDSDSSEISLSTSGVSSLNPRTKYNVNTLGSEIKCSYKRHTPVDLFSEQSSSKRICIQVPSGSASCAISSDSFLLQNDPNQSRINYGSQYPSITRTFQTNSAVKYDVEDKRSNNNQTAASIVLGSTARKMLERLEKFRTPLHVSSTIPARSNEYKSTYANDVWKASRYPPYMNAFKRYKMMISKSRQLTEKNSDDEKKSSVIPQEFKPVISNDSKIMNSDPDPRPEIPAIKNTVPHPESSIETQSYEFSSPVFMHNSLYAGDPSSYNFSLPITLRNSGINNDLNVKSSSTFSNLKHSSTNSIEKQEFSVPKKTIKFNTETVWRCSNCFMEMPETKTACSKCWLPRNINDEAQNEIQDKIDSEDNETNSSEDENVDLDVSTSSCTATKKDEENSLKTSLLTSIPTNSTKWECETCLAQNDEIHEKCVCCSSNRPSAYEVITPVVTSFDHSLKSDKWECPTCLASNKQENTKCVCCQTMNPNNKENSQSNGVSSDKSLFSFGKTNDDKELETSKTPSFTFNFGVKTDNAENPGLFSFGAQNKPTSTSNTDSVPIFKFGNQKELHSKVESSNPDAGSFKFSFGNVDKINVKPSNTVSPFNFGNSTSTGSNFGSSNSSSTTFTFGSPANSAKTSADSSNFSFNSGQQTSTTQLAKPFTFSVASNQNSLSVNTGDSSTQNLFSLGAPKIPSFGQVEPNTTVGVNPFSASSNALTEHRVYRKANRRIRK